MADQVYLKQAPHGFGIVRLKILLALCRNPELDLPGFAGRFAVDISSHGAVKAGLELPKREVRLDGET